MSEFQEDKLAPDTGAGRRQFLVYVATGISQGVALWLLTRAGSDSAFSGHPALRSALVHFVIFSAAVWYLLHGSPLRPLARTAVALSIAFLISGLAAHAVASSGGRQGPPSFTLSTVVLSYVLVTLASGFDAQRHWFDYGRLFKHGWRNVLLLSAAGALTGVLWTLLWGAAFLLSALGVETLSTLLKETVVFEVLSCTACAFFMLQATLRGEALVALRKFWLTLNTWFLPLALALALVWIVALLAIGPQPLFQTRRAALLLFWFVALAVLFMNAAYQDGRAVPYARWVAAAATWAWLSIPVLAGIGLWALSVRVHQHGWSVERLWAAVVGGLASVYGLGYSGAVVARSRWMRTLETTNIVASLALVLVIVAFTSPLADIRRIAVESQVTRLRTGGTGASRFDFAALNREGGKWGRAALAEIAADESLSAALRSGAQAELAGTRRGNDQDQDHDVALATLRKQVKVLPSGVVADPQLLEHLARGKADWSEKMCLRDATQCALWIVDLDGDGKAEAILLRGEHRSVHGTVYTSDVSGWKREAELQGPPVPMAEWIAAIEAGEAVPSKPRWPDLQIGGTRYAVRQN